MTEEDKNPLNDGTNEKDKISCETIANKTKQALNGSGDTKGRSRKRILKPSQPPNHNNKRIKLDSPTNKSEVNTVQVFFCFFFV